jgi:hypothetical protein
MKPCKICGIEIEYGEMATHLQSAHHITPKVKTPKLPPSAEEHLRSLQKQTQDAVEKLEEERDIIHHKLLELDNTIAAYKKLLIKS